uniref:Uncharacterized protein n=1 Tax=Physcomitrium patens TaxID=3218 RepID=A0A2K1KUK8_PHYPA|nr:hypothetical protein PHYPA_004455 [Physcomitrium patens]
MGVRSRGIEPRSVPWEGTMIPLHQLRPEGRAYASPITHCFKHYIWLCGRNASPITHCFKHYIWLCGRNSQTILIHVAATVYIKTTQPQLLILSLRDGIHSTKCTTLTSNVLRLLHDFPPLPNLTSGLQPKLLYLGLCFLPLKATDKPLMKENNQTRHMQNTSHTLKLIEIQFEKRKYILNFSSLFSCISEKKIKEKKIRNHGNVIGSRKQCSKDADQISHRVVNFFVSKPVFHLSC